MLKGFFNVPVPQNEPVLNYGPRSLERVALKAALEQARAQQPELQVRVEDGWVYFIHGWTRVIADVFNIDIPTRGAGFDRLSDIAHTVSQKENPS